MNTYESLLTFSNLLSPEGKDIPSSKLVEEYNDGRQTEVISFIFCHNYQLLRMASNRYYGLSMDDKDSFILEEIAKAIDNYNSDKNTKLITLITTYVRNRLRTETQALQANARKTLDYATSFEDLGEMDRLWEAGDNTSFSYAEMYELVNTLELTENERKCCEIIILNNEDIKNSEIAELLGISRAGVGHIKKSLKTKLSPIFGIN